MTRGPWLLARFAGAWHFEVVERGSTRVRFCYSLQARPAWLAPLLNPVLAWFFARDTRQRLAALKAAAEAERAPTPRGVLRSP